MDRSWLVADRRSREYKLGVEDFLKFAVRNARNPKQINCPCILCVNDDSYSVLVVKDHLFLNGIDPSYVIWSDHGEAALVSDTDESSEHEYSDHGIDTDSDESVQGNMEIEMNSDIELDFGENEEQGDERNEFQRLVEEANKPLYPGCKKHTKFSALLRLQNLKAKQNMGDGAYSDWLEVIGDFLPEGNELPYNSDEHWVLTVVDPEKERVYHMDPMKRRLPMASAEWKSVVNSAITMYNTQKGKPSLNAVDWKNLGGVPHQPDHIQCGFYVMRFMRDIIYDQDQSFVTKWDRRNKLCYTQGDMDVLRNEWGKFIIKKYP